MGYPLCTNKRTRNGSEKRNKLGREFINYVGCIQCTTETTILVLFRYRYQNPNGLIVSADSVTDTETTFQRENLVTKSMGYFFNHKKAH